jgi:hypothetical protein
LLRLESGEAVGLEGSLIGNGVEPWPLADFAPDSVNRQRDAGWPPEC